MNIELMDEIKAAAYFQWEYTCQGNVLEYWDCAEDIACFLEQHDILDESKIQKIVRLGIYDLGYLEFVRHIAYRVFLYTSNGKAQDNWLMAEKLINNKEWRAAITAVARRYNTCKRNPRFYESLRCEAVKEYYCTNGISDI